MKRLRSIPILFTYWKAPAPVRRRVRGIWRLYAMLVWLALTSPLFAFACAAMLRFDLLLSLLVSPLIIIFVGSLIPFIESCYELAAGIEKERRRLGCCTRCWYQMENLPRCPECGHEPRA